MLFQLNETSLVFAEDGGAIHQAVQKLVGRRTVPQVFINGIHVGGADGMFPLFLALPSLFLSV